MQMTHIRVIRGLSVLTQICVIRVESVKRPGRPLVAASAPGPSPCRLLHLIDRTSKLTFLVDTGAQVSVVPPTQADRFRKQAGFSLSAINGSAIATFGTHSLTLNLGLRRIPFVGFLSLPMSNSLY